MNTKSPNFSSLEKEYLLQAIEKEKHVIENKCNNGSVVRQKEGAWNRVVQDFNANPRVTARNSKQLKACWKNLKSKSKSEVATVRKSIKQTGGGPGTTDVSPITEQIFSMVPSQIRCIENPYDNDADFYGDGVEDNTDDSVDEDVNIGEEHQPSSSSTSLYTASPADITKSLPLKKKASQSKVRDYKDVLKDYAHENGYIRQEIKST